MFLSGSLDIIYIHIILSFFSSLMGSTTCFWGLERNFVLTIDLRSVIFFTSQRIWGLFWNSYPMTAGGVIYELSAISTIPSTWTYLDQPIVLRISLSARIIPP